MITMVSFVLPLNNIEASKGTTKETKFVRPMPDSGVQDYRKSVGDINWKVMIEGMSSSKMVDTFQEMITSLVDIHFPLKKITVSQYDKPWFTQELRTIRRQRQRLYRKEGRSQAYLLVKKEFDLKLEKEAAKYVEKIQNEVSEGKRGSSYSALRKLGNRDFEDTKYQKSFDIPEFLDEGLDDKDSAEAIADYFSSISQEFEPISVEKFSPLIKDELETGQCGGLRKSSISHYLIKLLHFIQFNIDKPQSHAVLLACIDMSKAFNRMSNQRVIEDLYDMKVPGWLLLILISYLTDRKMVVKFRGIVSLLRNLPGSSPQGVFLG